MPAIALTAAEIAAAEAAAIAAAEAAAIQAAQVAAAEAAAQAAATAAAEQAAAQAATQAATQQASTSGIQTLAQEVAGTTPTGIETLNVGQAPGMSEAQYQFLHNSTASTDPTAVGEIIKSFPPAVTSPVPVPPPPAPVVNPGPAPHLSALPEFNPQQYLIDTSPGSFVAPPAAPPAAPLYGSAQPSAPPSMGPNTFPDAYRGDSSLYGINAPGYSSLNVRPDLTGPSPYSLGNETVNYNIAQTGPPAPPQEPGGLQGLFNQGLDYAKKNPLTTLMGATTLSNYLDKPDPYEKPKYKSTFKPGLYSGYQPVQPTPYRPNYAVGGLADLGGYSDGGRMLKGPGDGMSDDIPATIANKQPARLANEEFVIPADVVSHLGNGSSEAGAKQLYKMMERVRKARTGNKKQGKQINPEKYLA
jgi:hypothetical protein